MTDILVKPRELRQTAEDIRTRAKKIEQAIEAVSGVVLGAGFHLVLSGNRADKLFSRFRQTKGTLETFENLVIRFAEELREIADRFSLADQVKKKVLYIINGINYTDQDYNGDGVPDGREGMDAMKRELEKVYGAEVEVRLITDNPYYEKMNKNLNLTGTNLEGTNLQGTNSGGGLWGNFVDGTTGLFAQGVNSITNGGASTINLATDFGAEVINSAHYGRASIENSLDGVGKVVTGHFGMDTAESNRVYGEIYDYLERDGLLNSDDVDIMLVGHSGGGVIISNIVERLEGEAGVNVSGVMTMGSPFVNYEKITPHLGDGEKLYDVQSQGDWFGTFSFVGPVRSDSFGLMDGEIDGSKIESRMLSGDYNFLEVGDAHGSYHHSHQIVEWIGDMIYEPPQQSAN